MDLRRLRLGEWLAGLGGVALLGVMLLDWYDAANAWEAFFVVDIVLALAALYGIALAVMTATHHAAAVSIALASLLGSVSLIAAVLVLWRAIDAPGSGDATRELGLWLGLAACWAVAAGAVLAMRDERFPRAARSNPPVETLPPPEGGRA